MIVQKYIERAILVDALVRNGDSAGPHELAAALGLSESGLHRFMGLLREELGCPIEYCRATGRYRYTEPGRMAFGYSRHGRLEDPGAGH